MKVGEILKSKGSKVVTTRPDTKISTLVRLLNLEKIGAVVVSNDGVNILGIVSERDVIRALGGHDSELLDMQVSDLMTREVLTCTLEDTIQSVMMQMTQRRVRHIPVVGEGKLCGIISIGDVVKNRLEELELETNLLRDYITAS